MTDSLLIHTCDGIRFVHVKLLEITRDLSAEQFYWRPSHHAPPIGWHLWHVARWADRVRTFFPIRDEVEHRQIWETERLAAQWDVDPSELGPLQTGEGMEHEAAARIMHQIGQENIVDYATRCFELFDQELDSVTPSDTEWFRPSPLAFAVTEDGSIVAAQAPERPFAFDLQFHTRHSARHLGMVEALIGSLDRPGTATI